MVTLHVHRWGLNVFRESLDVDLGLPRVLAKDPWIVEQLLEKGYFRRGGNTFIRTVTDLPTSFSERATTRPEAAIDILIAPYTSRARDNVRLGDHLTTSEVPGLATALRRPSVDVELTLVRLNSSVRTTSVMLPDEVSVLILRAFAWQTRGKDTDAIDLWRALEIAYAAGVTFEDLPEADRSQVRDIVWRAFAGRIGSATDSLLKAQGLFGEGTQRLQARIRALTSAVLGDNPEGV